jgi:hypothetical protein
MVADQGSVQRQWRQQQYRYSESYQIRPQIHCILVDYFLTLFWMKIKVNSCVMRGRHNPADSVEVSLYQ